MLDVIEREQLRQNASRVGARVKRELWRLSQDPAGNLIGSVRGCGLFIGVEFVRDRSSLEPAVRFEPACTCEKCAVCVPKSLCGGLALIMPLPQLLLLSIWQTAETSYLCSRLKDVHRILTSIDGPHDNVRTRSILHSCVNVFIALTLMKKRAGADYACHGTKKQVRSTNTLWRDT